VFKVAQIPTPHIGAKIGDFARTVLMPGDPLRAKFIADTFLKDAILVNNVRGVQGYTGFYEGKRVSVMASGMGMPSIGIYSYELFNFYGVENIIRVGSAGAMSDKLKLRDVVAGMSAYTNSAFGEQFGFRGTLAPACSYELLTASVGAAKEIGVNLVPGPIFSSDTFYDAGEPGDAGKLMKLGVLAVEMEAYALYLTAAAAGKNALALLTISDSLVTGEALPAEDRQTTFTDMMKIALAIA
jgi:purine-nucleoside phosphorylase